MKLSIKEYAEKRGISPQAVYQAVAKGTLKYVKENGKKYIIADNTEVKAVPTSVDVDCTKKLEKALKKLQKQQRTVLKLKHKLELAEVQLNSIFQLVESRDREIEVLQRSFGMLSTVVEKKLIPGAVDTDAVDAELEEPKNKKSKKKKKKR